MTNSANTQKPASTGTSNGKRVFIAGASGAIGRQLVPLLVSAGWSLAGCTRSAEKLPLLRELGVEGYQADVYDAARLRSVLLEVRPDIVIHQLTDLPYALAADQMADALPRNARLRDEGTRHLVAAAVAAGARRLIAQSIGFIYAEKQGTLVETDALLPEDHVPYGGTVIGVKSLERQVVEASLEGIVLRYGLLYGPGTGFDAPIAPGSVHVAAAAKAAELAMTRGSAGLYNVCEATGQVSSQKAISQLGWDAAWRSGK